MSINSLMNAAAARRPDFAPLGEVPKGLDQIARASRTPPASEDTAAAGQPAPTQVDTTLNVLFNYIPTEVLTLYVAVLAAIQPGVSSTALAAPAQSSVPPLVLPAAAPNLWIPFWIFLVATPIVSWLVFAAKIKAAQKPIPIRMRTWPMWEMFAATLAFVAWAFALPSTPFSSLAWYSTGLAGIVVLIVSTLLGLLAPLFQRPLSK